MNFPKQGKLWTVVALCGALAACGGNTPLGPITAGGDPGDTVDTRGREGNAAIDGGSSIWDLFGPDTTDQTVNVNKYLWNASLDVLNFLPVQSIDPFTGVIVTGFGTPPGGGRAYRATIHVKDPALEARSLAVSLQSQGGPVAAGTVRAVEDAILARARQMRIADNRF
jgi:hypothetical protein